MNLEDLIDESGLQQDEWSLTKPVFGKEGQLQVVGWCGKCHKNKYYILKCRTCLQDHELYGEGCFRSTRVGLIRGKIPCGCAFNPRWSKEQHFIRCSRKAEELGYKFLGFEGEWKCNITKIKLLCSIHGEWVTGNISGLMNSAAGCPACAMANTFAAVTKPDDVMIKSFQDSGSFHPDTKFWRSNRLNRAGYKPYWSLYCPDCESLAESTSNDLQKGHKSCACSPMRQQECYINLVSDAFKNIVAIKFGIANDSKVRIRKQNKLSVYDVHNHSIFKFQTINACKKAERECKQELECGVLTKEEMPDGYTETTWVYNLEKIIEIYERNGGTRQENP